MTSGENDAKTKSPADYRRQIRIFDPTIHSGFKVSVIGCGNTGSYAAYTLARMGIQKLDLYDPDIVEAHNITSQLFWPSDIGVRKIEALKWHLLTVNPALEVEMRVCSFTGIEPHGDIIIIAVDTMEARRMIADGLANSAAKIIDCRVGGPQIEIYSCSNAEEWQKTFVDAVADPCGGQFIAYVSAIAGGLVANTVRKLLVGDAADRAIMINVNSLQVAKNFSWHESPIV